MTSVYPSAVVTSAELPTHNDGDVIYGSQMNNVQNEIIAIETALGVGTTLVGAYATLVDRLAANDTSVSNLQTSVASASGVHALVVGSDVVGTLDTQTLSGKTLSSPTLTGTVAAGGATVSGSVVFSGGVDLTQSGALNVTEPIISGWANANHDHSTTDKGGNIPESSVTNLTTDLSNKAALVHTHTASQVTGLANVAYSGNYSDLAGSPTIGTSAALDVPSTPGGVAQTSQVVRGDDPRLANTRTPAAHAATHATGGSDPVGPSDIGAAPTVHTHTKSQITDFAHPLYGSYHTGTLPISSIDNLQSDLDAKLGVNATAVNSAKINGVNFTVATSAPGGPSTRDVWISY